MSNHNTGRLHPESSIPSLEAILGVPLFKNSQDVGNEIRDKVRSMTPAGMNAFIEALKNEVSTVMTKGENNFQGIISQMINKIFEKTSDNNRR